MAVTVRGIRLRPPLSGPPGRHPAGALGTGKRLFPASGPAAYLECLSALQADAAVLAAVRENGPMTACFLVPYETPADPRAAS